MKILSLWLSLLASFCLIPGYVNAAVIESGTIYQTNSNGATIDYWSFSIGSDELITIDTLSWETDNGFPEMAVDVNGDGEIAFIDTHILLFSDDGDLSEDDFIAESSGDFDVDEDDFITDFTSWDAYLEVALTAGDYILAISTYFLGIDEAVDGVVNNDFDFPITAPFSCEGEPGELCGDALEVSAGDYQIEFSDVVDITGVTSTSVMVPEPSALAIFGLGLLGLGVLRRRNQS